MGYFDHRNQTKTFTDCQILVNLDIHFCESGNRKELPFGPTIGVGYIFRDTIFL